GGFVVSQWNTEFFSAGGGGGVGEAVFGSGVADDVKPHAGVLHFDDEIGDVVRGDHVVVAASVDLDLGFDVAFFDFYVGLQGAVEADYAFQRQAEAGHGEGDGAAEAVALGSYLAGFNSVVCEIGRASCRERR